MKILDQEQDVVDLAAKLGLTGLPVEAIIDFCQLQIDDWVEEDGSVKTIGDLETLAATRSLSENPVNSNFHYYIRFISQPKPLYIVA